jgi:1,4-dihydroxy-2-naphthoyl-CoA hydrolase
MGAVTVPAMAADETTARAVMGARADMTYLPIESTFIGFLDPRFEEPAAPGELRCTVPVRPELLQPMGIVHGGIYSAIAETVASMGAARDVGVESGLAVMGQANNTSFLRPVTQGAIHATGVVRHRGRTTQIWQIEMTDDEGRLCALAQVTMAVRPTR